MNLVKIYGIKNCDTMKKALNWLDENGIAYDFFNYKKQGADEQVVRAAIAQHGWDTVINRRGTSWRQLPDEQKEAMDEETAVKAALENPSLIKRPLMMIGDETFLGFDKAEYEELLG